MLYSHDTHGLGHIRRNRKVADALLSVYPDASIVIATGSSFAGGYRQQNGVTLAQMPPVKKLADGSYGSADPVVTFSRTITERQRVLIDTACDFQPDLLITDKEAGGLTGELLPVLEILKATGARMVLGLREVLDEPEAVKREWARNRTHQTIERFYDAIWVYGPDDFHDPLAGLDVSETVSGKRQFVGYLPFDPGVTEPRLPTKLPEEFILVTTGGGGDGEALLRAVFEAAKTGAGFRIPLVILPGPYLNEQSKSELLAEAKRIGGIHLLDFDPESERLMAASSGVVAMCGYNTFCEVIQLDKPALFVPRETPRREQLIRAERAAELGLSQVMRIGDAADAERLHDTIAALPTTQPPSKSAYKPDFSGVENVAAKARRILEAGS